MGIGMSVSGWWGGGVVVIGRGVGLMRRKNLQIIDLQEIASQSVMFCILFKCLKAVQWS